MRTVSRVLFLLLSLAATSPVLTTEVKNGFRFGELSGSVADAPLGWNLPAMVSQPLPDAVTYRWGEAEFLEPAEGVLGISLHGINRAYPIKILNYHEIVNDPFGEEAVVVTFCPPCGTGIVFRGSFDGVEHTFGVSGLLYNSECPSSNKWNR